MENINRLKTLAREQQNRLSMHFDPFGNCGTWRITLGAFEAHAVTLETAARSVITQVESWRNGDLPPAS